MCNVHSHEMLYETDYHPHIRYCMKQTTISSGEKIAHGGLIKHTLFYEATIGSFLSVLVFPQTGCIHIFHPTGTCAHVQFCHVTIAKENPGENASQYQHPYKPGIPFATLYCQ